MRKSTKSVLAGVLTVGLAASMTTPVLASESQSAKVTATVVEAVNEPTYIMTIPAEFNLGELSTVDNIGVAYDVTVEITEGNTGNNTFNVTADDYGDLYSGENALEYWNTFGTQTYGYTQTIGAHLLVLADNVAAAEPGNYEGTVSFTISQDVE